jgi:20S proteasome subunit alpha 3
MSTEPKTNVFTEDGRILQVEYAIKNVSEAGTIIGMTCKDGVVLVGMKKGEVLTHREKIYKLSNEIYGAICGTFSDSLQIIGYARLKAQEFLEELGIPMPVGSMCKAVGKLKQAFTQGGGMRPFGVSLLYAGRKDGKYCLYSTDPSGTISKWMARCYGEGEDGINNAFKNDLAKDEYSLEEGTREVIRILSKTKECSAKDASSFEILHLREDTAHYLSHDQVLSLLKENEGKNK